MERIFKLLNFKSAGVYTKYALALFLLSFAIACKHPTKNIQLVSNNSKATGIFVPQEIINGNDGQAVKLQLQGAENKLGILGNWVAADGGKEFRPLIALSPGLTYEVRQGTHLLATIAVPAAKGAVPVVKAIYPLSDTVPENLLKIYIQFSRPMRTGNALDHICLLDKNKDTMQRVFLNLQPELWDTTGTVLTLWLDPGRIKRELVLNRELGNPLKKAQSYQLVIAGNWKDTQGQPLSKPYTKRFTVGERDGEMPDINKWQIFTPKAGTKDALKITINEPLDHYLLGESISVMNEKGEAISGYVNTAANDKVWIFNPASVWVAGHYQLKAAARLEDLAGNNLNRVFDRDIRKDKQQNKDVFVRGFEVK